jgi:hypothetical protein
MPPRDQISLSDVIDSIAAFLFPVLKAARSDFEREMTWAPGGPWKKEDAI